MKSIATLFIAGIVLGSLGGCTLIPEPRQAAAPRKAQNTAYAASRPAQKCLAELGQTGSRFSPIPDKYYGAGCSTLNAVRINALGGNNAGVTLTNMGPITCPAAQSMARWAREGVDHAAKEIFGSRLQRIETMGSYACRNVAGTNRRSAHSKAAAIDISAFILANGQRISVKNDWKQGSSKQRRFLRQVHASACARFGTVLGPEYNAAHRDHFHLEQGPGKFCR